MKKSNVPDLLNSKVIDGTPMYEFEHSYEDKGDTIIFPGFISFEIRAGYDSKGNKIWERAFFSLYIKNPLKEGYDLLGGFPADNKDIKRGEDDLAIFPEYIKKRFCDEAHDYAEFWVKLLASGK